LREHYHNYPRIQKSDGDPAILAGSVVQGLQHRGGEHPVSVREVQPMLPNILLVLVRIPLELHTRSIARSPMRRITFQQIDIWITAHEVRIN